MGNRKPNTTCSNCNTPIYRRPYEIERGWKFYCSKKCESEVREIPNRPCGNCEKIFKPTKRSNIYCSKSCAVSKSRMGLKMQNLGFRGKHGQRVSLLTQESGRYECMIDGCDYSICLDVHRLVPGKEGGEYELGNMFLVCPNDHAEVTRGHATVKKVGKYRLKKTRKGKPMVGDGTPPLR